MKYKMFYKININQCSRTKGTNKSPSLSSNNSLAWQQFGLLMEASKLNTIEENMCTRSKT